MGKLPILAEDLGVITADVVALREAINAPGMAVLQFAFGSDAANPHLPHNHRPLEFVYPGTHDNDTTAGWYARIAPEERAAFHAYINKSALFGFADVPWLMIQVALSSVAYTTVIQMQDILVRRERGGEGGGGRIQQPGVYGPEGGPRERPASSALTPLPPLPFPPGPEQRRAHEQARPGGGQLGMAPVGLPVFGAGQAGQPAE